VYYLHAGLGIDAEEDFEGFIEYTNRIEMGAKDLRRLESVVHRMVPKDPFYICTIKKSNIVKGKAKMVII
jgi:hypothetical protein